MEIVGLDYLQSLIEKQYWSAKMVFNARGAIVFPVHREHRDHSIDCVRYADNYKGNAMAAMLSPGRIEIRYHEAFRDAEVSEIIRKLLVTEFFADFQWSVTYQGRPLEI